MGEQKLNKFIQRIPWWCTVTAEGLGSIPGGESCKSNGTVKKKKVHSAFEQSLESSGPFLLHSTKGILASQLHSV